MCVWTPASPPTKMMYDDGYITRKMAAMPPPSYPYGGAPYGGGYMPPMYPPMGPPRMMPGMYDYGYGGGYMAPYYGGGYAAPPPPPPPYPAAGGSGNRMSRYDHYLDDGDLDYSPRYRTNYKAVDEVESKPTRALQDHVDKMRVRLKSLAYSLDPSGPVPDIVIPDRSGKKGSETKTYSLPAIEYKELPSLKRSDRYYPEDEHIKDNLRIRCLSQYKSTRTAAVLPDSGLSRYTSKYGSGAGTRTSKWDDPSSVYGAAADSKPYSKDSHSVRFDRKAITDGGEEPSEEKKERRKKKKSKEPEEVKISVDDAPAAVEGGDGEAAADEEVLDEKERKKLEKKRRKAEREAAAKAAMEAELEALAAAEAELALLEAGGAPAEEAPAPEAAPAEVAEVVEAPVEEAAEPAGNGEVAAAEKSE